MSNAQRLDSLGLLRGIAVLMVCFCHFGGALLYGNSYITIFKAFHDYGKFGVHMFFVISGFIIPLSLYNGKFGISDYFTFLYKRVIRLHPPYLLALAVTLTIMFYSYHVRNEIFPENISTIFQSLFYLHIPADNPVFWTLIVEWEYYLFIGITFCFLIKYPKLSLGFGVPILLAVAYLWLSNISLFAFIVFFLIGIAGFMVYSKQGSPLLNKLMLAGLILFSFCFYELAAAVTSLFTILFILLYKKNIPKYLLFTGEISYSIYLIHYPIGVKFLNLLYPKLDQQYAWELFFADLLFIILLSYCFYKLVEVPSERFAGKFKYKRKQKFKLEVRQVISF